MTDEQMHNLQPGDVVVHELDHTLFMVMENYGNRVIAVRTVPILVNGDWFQKWHNESWYHNMKKGIIYDVRICYWLDTHVDIYELVFWS